LNLHFHVLWMDGVFATGPAGEGLSFRDHGMVSDGDVAALVKTIRDRVRRLVTKHGKWSEPGERPADDPAAVDPGLRRIGRGSPRNILDELRQVQSADVVLPTSMAANSRSVA